MATETVGLLHPGEMGTGVAACLVAAGIPVLWCTQGRSERSATRATEAGLTPVASVEELTARSTVIVSICPPHAAADVAEEVSSFTGTYVDANAISPALARQIAARIVARGGTYVDGSIIGLPPTPSRTARLYLSGESASSVAALFTGTRVDARVLEEDPVAASALKMTYAAWTKGTQALIVAIQQVARATGVEQPLLEEWAISQPTLEETARSATRQSAEKGWRWTAEMEQIAATFADSGLPDGFHRAAAEIFRRASDLPGPRGDATHSP